MANFMTGKKIEFLNIAGVPYGTINIEKVNPLYVTTLQEGKSILQSAIKDGHIDADEAMVVENQMIEANLPTDSTALYAALAAFRLPDGFVPSVSFEICANCTDNEKHGYVTMVSENKRTSLPVFDLFDGFMQCEANVRFGEVHPLDAINVFQNMIKAGLPEKITSTNDDTLFKTVAGIISKLLFGR